MNAYIYVYMYIFAGFMRDLMRSENIFMQLKLYEKVRKAIRLMVYRAILSKTWIISSKLIK